LRKAESPITGVDSGRSWLVPGREFALYADESESKGITKRAVVLQERIGDLKQQEKAVEADQEIGGKR
jgi:hypothetical protein